ncbi:XRE family transcriptional regulator [Streptomyces cyaneochromogenes]|uniref:XRE family transcriptional regulator n=1 Tax=Streptomyces cyaneochromogenes TaxID=2496836 RepID=A0A3Q9F0A1_9ACTN|nr:helix-turn-helix transcriptional regulator [Streptomyces cyaneochromogenes]AZQ32117.1 XRE family transcriptional regulator [Streptomyces cyaneochromogenes]AZQ40106.1 XRE family transcriptional regulator [Streptomyces cyaneochromogenes]
MAGTTPRYDSCRYCKRRFAQTSGPGRKKEYCTKDCRGKAQRERDGRGQQHARTALPLGRRIAEHLQALSAALLEAEYDGRPLEELLRCAGDVSREVEYYVAAAVQDARNGGASWDQVAEAARISATTARTRWPENRVRERLKRRAAERSAVRQPPAPPVEDPQAAEGNPLSQSAERASVKLASALSHLHRASDLTISKVADELSLSPSYVSRILSGERTPTWLVLCAMVELFDGEPEELKALFESAHGLVAPARHAVPDAVARLQAALRGLHLAAGRPQVGVVRKATHGALSTQEINEILGGEMVPGWEQTSALVTAMGGWPADVRPLWEAVHYTFLLCVDPEEGPRRPPAADPESI